MDIVRNLEHVDAAPVKCVEMHTCGESTRIIVKGFPSTFGTLLEQRREAKEKYDHIRRQVILEPRGHSDKYGAILRPETELTRAGEAHIGVLFIHNEGYSTMCGHATIALGRFLIDTFDKEVFPLRDKVVVDYDALTAQINLHAPCGLVHITVPLTEDLKSDRSKPVSFASAPCFKTASDLAIRIPAADRWPELCDKESVKVDIAYGGAFSCLISATELGFGERGLEGEIDLHAMARATKALKRVCDQSPEVNQYFEHPEQNELNSLYTTIITDKSLGHRLGNSKGAETGLCFFGDEEIDRSPTGSAVAARAAVAYAKGQLQLGESWSYHSCVSNAMGGLGGFIATPLEVKNFAASAAEYNVVKVEGFAYYTGSHSFVTEPGDKLGQEGFLFRNLNDTVARN